MFFMRQLKQFSRCNIAQVLKISNRRISKTVQCMKKDDVYVQRITERFAERVCEYPLLMDPNCKIAIITGGETGIGLATANVLLTNGAQMVVLAGVCDGESAVKQINEEHGQGRACFMHMDVNDPKDFDELFYRVNMVYGGVDIVFNNAGIMQDQIWEYEIDTNLKSVMRGTITGMEYMGKGGRGKKRGQGVIINHADVLALEVFPYAPGYVATKAGIVSATLSFGSSYHYQKSGVRVVGLLSGPTDTSLLRNAAEKQLDPESGKTVVAALTERPPQSPAVVGRGVLHMIKYAPAGSLWTVERGQLSITKLPSRHTFNTVITQL